MKYKIVRQCGGSWDYLCDYDARLKGGHVWKHPSNVQGMRVGMPCGYDRGQHKGPVVFNSLRTAKVACKKLMNWWNMPHMVVRHSNPRQGGISTLLTQV